MKKLEMRRWSTILTMYQQFKASMSLSPPRDGIAIKESILTLIDREHWLIIVN
jgi:hypothetical protein